MFSMYEYPNKIPKDWSLVVFQGMCLVVSVTNGSALLQAFSKKKGAILFPLGQLSMTDRKEIVQKGLDMFGKKLSEAAFNNQVQNSYCSTFYCVCVCVITFFNIYQHYLLNEVKSIGN